jgi:hypothetical protein
LLYVPVVPTGHSLELREEEEHGLPVLVLDPEDVQQGVDVTPLRSLPYIEWFVVKHAITRRVVLLSQR